MTPDELLKFWPIISTILLALGGFIRWLVSVLRELDEQKAEAKVWESIAKGMLPVLKQSEHIASKAASEVIDQESEGRE